jgi:hypothetical protein
MKVQIITLDSQDDQVSARDKLSWAQASRVLLVWPGRGTVLTRRLDLVLLQRQARRQGAQLGLVTHDPQVLDNARALGIPVFGSLGAVPERAWPRTAPSQPLALRARDPGRRAALVAQRQGVDKPSRLNRIVRWPAFTFGMLSVLALGSATIPYADVVLAPRIQPEAVELTIHLDPEVRSPQADGRIPSRQVSTQVDGQLRTATTGEVSVPAVAARGTVVFTNLTDAAVSIPEGASVLPVGHPELRYATLAAASLPGRRGAQASVDVQAVETGSPTNVPSGTINAVDGPLGLQVSVTNPDPMAGGAEQARAAVAAADQALLAERLRQQIIGQAAGDIASTLGPGEALAEGSVRVLRVVSETFDHAPGEPADALALQLTLEVGGLAYSMQDVQAAGSLALQAKLPRGSQAVPESAFFRLAQGPSTAGATDATLHLHAQQQTFVAPDLARARALVRGQEPAAAAQRLSQAFTLASPPTIRTTPDWLPVLPWLDLRIGVRWIWQAG